MVVVVAGDAVVVPAVCAWSFFSQRPQLHPPHPLESSSLEPHPAMITTEIRLSMTNRTKKVLGFINFIISPQLTGL